MNRVRDIRVQAERPRLEARLDGLPPGGIALVSGRAGYGKSSAVAAWGGRGDGAMRWLRARDGLAGALILAADGDDGTRLPRLCRAVRRDQPIRAQVAALLADLAAPHAEITLVVDDVDALANAREGLAFLCQLAEREPDGARAILVGRHVAALRMAVARSKRAIVEIGAPDLRLSPLQARQIAETRSWDGGAGTLEIARREAAGNGGIFAAWVSAQVGGGAVDDLDDFVRRDVVGQSAALLARLAAGQDGEPSETLLRSLWSEGLLVAPAESDELGTEGWRIPESIARVLGVAPQVAVRATPRAAHRTVRPMPPDRRVAIVHDLGPLGIDVEGRTIDGTGIRPRSLALLLYLATRPRHAATRDEVIDALWPEADEAAGLNSLNQAIFHLRRTIDPGYEAAAAHGGATPYVRHEGEVVSLHPEFVRFDSAAVLAGLDRIRRTPRPEDLDALLAAYHGPFGVEMPFEPWVEQHRSTLEVGLLALVERSVLAAHEAGDLDRAVDLALRASRIDPEDGALFERLALLLDESGSLASARRAARRAVALLGEMDLEPPPELLRIGAKEGGAAGRQERPRSAPEEHE